MESESVARLSEMLEQERESHRRGVEEERRRGGDIRRELDLARVSIELKTVCSIHFFKFCSLHQ